MKRIAFVAAAALLGTGCISTTTTNPPPPPQQTGSVIFYWAFARAAPAQNGGYIYYDDADTGADGACPESLVDTVEVITPVSDFEVTCVYGGVEGAIADLLPAGTQTVQLRGWRGNTLVYDSGALSVDVLAGMETPYWIDLYGVPAHFDAFARMQYVDSNGDPQYYQTCQAAAYPTIDYTISDWLGHDILTGSVACQAPATQVPVVSADLDLDNYTVRFSGYTGGNPGTRTLDSCASSTLKLLAFDHFGDQSGYADGLTVTMYTPPRCSL